MFTYHIHLYMTYKHLILLAQFQLYMKKYLADVTNNPIAFNHSGMTHWCVTIRFQVYIKHWLLMTFKVIQLLLTNKFESFKVIHTIMAFPFICVLLHFTQWKRKELSQSHCTSRMAQYTLRALAGHCSYYGTISSYGMLNSFISLLPQKYYFLVSQKFVSSMNVKHLNLY